MREECQVGHLQYLQTCQGLPHCEPLADPIHREDMKTLLEKMARIYTYMYMYICSSHGRGNPSN